MSPITHVRAAVVRHYHAWCDQCGWTVESPCAGEVDRLMAEHDTRRRRLAARGIR